MSGLVTSRGNSPASWSRPADGWAPGQGYLLSVVSGERGGEVHDIILTIVLQLCTLCQLSMRIMCVVARQCWTL